MVVKHRLLIESINAAPIKVPAEKNNDDISKGNKIIAQNIANGIGKKMSMLEILLIVNRLATAEIIPKQEKTAKTFKPTFQFQLIHDMLPAINPKTKNPNNKNIERHIIASFGD